ncbi:MAG TPA: carbon storage regulator [Gemmatimonadales bacterium]|nr:carbon storage regulator [Gemmatimonadales bacterium]
MLVLTRRRGQAVVIDGGIRIVVLESERRMVRLGIEAPASTGIHREEIVSVVAAENRRARGRTGRRAWAEVLPLRSPDPGTASTRG